LIGKSAIVYSSGSRVPAASHPRAAEHSMI
jgi:hypothetical protein